MTFANVPPWFCFVSPTEHQCHLGPTVLLPGDSVDLFATVDFPVAASVCHLDNLAHIVWLAGFGDADPADDFDWATALIPAAHCPPPVGEKTNLEIEKEAWKAVCTDKFGHFECDYLVVVRNAGPGNYAASIKVDETVPAGTTATFFAAPGWTCTAVAPYSCEHAPIVLAPNQSRSFGVRVKVPKNLAEPLACEATNKVKIAEAAGGTDQNTDPTDDEAEATMILPGNVADCPGLPPLSNLKLFKTGPAEKCPLEGSDWACEFKIKVQNFGKDYTSPLQFIDFLPFGTPAGTTVIFDAPANWSCGGPVLFPTLYQCKSDNPDFSHMEFEEIFVKVKVPVETGTPKCEVTNNAPIAKAPGGTLINSFAGDDMSSARQERPLRQVAQHGRGMQEERLDLER